MEPILSQIRQKIDVCDVRLVLAPRSLACKAWWWFLLGIPVSGPEQCRGSIYKSALFSAPGQDHRVQIIEDLYYNPRMVSSKAIATLFAISSLASAQDVDYDDIPSQCTQVCDPIVRLTQQCDNGRSDADQLSCVCQANNATVQLPACEACFAMFDPDGHDNGMPIECLEEC